MAAFFLGVMLETLVIDNIVSFLGNHIWVSIVFSAFVGLMAAIYTIKTQRLIDKRRATIDMLMSKVWDKDYIETAGAFYTSMKEQRKLMEDYDLFARVRDIKAKGDWDKLTDDERSRLEQGVVTITKVRSLLNDRELIAIGIREGTYDEVIFRRWWYSTFMKEWRSASALVSRIRSDPESGATQYAYRDMEALARRLGGRGAVATARAAYPVVWWSRSHNPPLSLVNTTSLETAPGCESRKPDL